MSNDPRLKLLQLLEKFQEKKLAVDVFCDSFEHTYNLELDKDALNVVETAAFKDLFEQVIWYSPFPEERENVANYRSEEDIARAIDIAVRKLQIGSVGRISE